MQLSARLPAQTPYLLAVASPGSDALQFAREALWFAQERDLTLTLAIGRVGGIAAKIAGAELAEQLAAFCERWNITLVTWGGSADIDAIIDGWAARQPKALMLGAKRPSPWREGLPGGMSARLRRAEIGRAHV